MTEELKQLREALRRVKYEAVSLADAQVIALEALTTSQPAQAGEVDERLAFEAWASRQSWFIPFMTRRRDMAGSTRLGQYVDPDMQAGWQAWQARASLPTQPAAQATPETLTLGPLAKRNIYDAIRGAYDLGYNDARNARTVPGDSAPGYDGRSVEEDHGGALFNLLSRRLKTATFTHPAPGVPDGEPKLTQEELLEVAKHAWLMARTADSLQFYRTLLDAAAQAKGGDHG